MRSKISSAEILAVGGSNIKAEVLSTKTNLWETISDYPLVMGCIHFKFVLKAVDLHFLKSYP